jgi:hypothetical protein
MERELAWRARLQTLFDVRDEGARVAEEASHRMLPVEGPQGPRIRLLRSRHRATAIDQALPEAARVGRKLSVRSGPGKRVHEQHDGGYTEADPQRKPTRLDPAMVPALVGLPLDASASSGRGAANR